MANRNQEKYPAENDFPNLDKTTAMLKDCMPLDVYAKLRDVYTPSGFTLDRAIQSCVDLPTTEKIGIVAGDEESYAVFAEVFDNIIEKRHGIKLSECINKTDLDPKKITGCVLDEKYVISSRVRTSRNLRGYCLSPFCCRSERREVERILSDALTTISNGEYHPLVTMDECLRQTLVNDHYLFRTPTTGFQLSAGCARDWPDARGIW
ncbi:arginine kinase-like [Saccoglossus kowalevskii]|uniref:Arginine kinase-like n=1 Tax=Saccoglossus kowalevskii TaxID=10224 RepID=A0ABM0MTM9_SACKO|nr:PREDICTED: arginine kinase-like [Saccoglossus kowalevskii]